ncbi:uncharacterized protein LY89DRAFT_665111 [Mollisia scopiformis]|uniref:2EXR domain-containing protein n=1 Tax=Mollisia scopiformis TaxID=149040 RepID=A0A194XP72_MOLSC|nr:uncharacterized protein LY89DRAFT_665111 [Mollisia scopiformis]KUJ21961.1 hypothetical protein LY89DRAFT_665111 [Mollisia scopiformis]
MPPTTRSTRARTRNNPPSKKSPPQDDAVSDFSPPRRSKKLRTLGPSSIESPPRMTRSMVPASVPDLPGTRRDWVGTLRTESKIAQAVVAKEPCSDETNVEGTIYSPLALWAMKSASPLVSDSVSASQDKSGEFYLFARLPAEIQLMIWKQALVPRIVGLKPDKIPAIFHACYASRKVSKYIFQNSQAHKTGVLLNPEVDILFFDRSSFSIQASYHTSAHHTLRCNETPSIITRHVQRVAFSVREIKTCWTLECFHCFMVYKLAVRFPELKELIIILRPGPLGAGYDDLYETELSSENNRTDSFLGDIKDMFKHAQKHKTLKASWKNVQLKLMRNETWVK